MAHKIIMPKQGLQMTEGYIAQWLKAEGDMVKLGEPLFEIETDKLTITIDSTAEGKLLKIVRPEGDTVPITEVIAYIGEEGEVIEDIQAPSLPADVSVKEVESPKESRRLSEPIPVLAQAGVKYATPRAKMRAQERGIPIESVDATGPDGLIIERDVLTYKPVAASPLARKLAGLGGISLDGVEGSGARGKVMAPDVRQALAAPSADDTSDCLETVIPMDGMRRGIASTMSDSLSATAQANHSMLVDMSECVRLRERMKKAEIKISFNDIIILCAARALKEHPQVNAVRQEDSIVQKHYVNVGMAVATPRGLLVPVIMDTDKKSLREIAGITAALAERTKKGTITPDELTQGTFTVTNLGMLGVDKFVAILNPPESGILAVGAIKKQPVVLEDDSIAVRPMMWITLTYDHCVIDGAPAASFLGRIKELLEDPILLL